MSKEDIITLLKGCTNYFSKNVTFGNTLNISSHKED